MSDNFSAPRRRVGDPRANIARLVILYAMAVILAIATSVLWLADDKSAASQVVFTSVLPLLGTWVGTVLAYYYSRENLVAANEATLKALETAGTFETPRQTVATVMVPLSSIKPMVEARDVAAADELPLTELRKRMERHQQKRLPVVTEDGQRPLLIVHLSHLDAYALASTRSKSTSSVTATLGDLRGDRDLRARTEAYVVVAPTATIEETRSAMGAEKSPAVKDAFVTEDGTGGSKVVGWVTDRLLLASS